MTLSPGSEVMRRLPVICLVLSLMVGIAAAAWAAAMPGMSLFGDLKYGPDFKNFDYANPNAPKGGTMRFSAIGTFDTLNPYVVKGVPAAGIGNILDSLMRQSQDEPGSEYGLVAESADLAPDRLSVLFTLRKEAQFHDGTPITPDDVVWTFETLRAKGLPMYRSYYGDVTQVVKEGERGVRFLFKSANNRELPVILGEMPVLSKAYWSGRDFEKTTLDAPLGSGPYKIEAVDPGRSITYRRVADYWAADLPVNKGRFNVDEIRYDYYRDRTIALEAFKAGQYDFRQESSSKAWATGYDSPALRSGLIKKEQIANDCRAVCRASPTICAARCSRIRGCARRWLMPSISNGRTRICSTAFTPGPAAISIIPSWPRRAFHRAKSSKSSTSIAARSRMNCLPRNTTRRNTTARAISATGCGRR